VRPFEWGLDWMPASPDGPAGGPVGDLGGDLGGDTVAGPTGGADLADGARVERWVNEVMRDTRAFLSVHARLR
jgi:hypothetical protein